VRFPGGLGLYSAVARRRRYWQIVFGMAGWWVVGFCLVPPATAAAGPLDKLARGVANIATGWMELPEQVGRTTETEGSIAAVTRGLVRGVGYTVGRTCIGVLETATFVLPNHPGESRQVGGDPYGPLIEPDILVFRRPDKIIEH